jgi:hypothetical protein
MKRARELAWILVVVGCGGGAPAPREPRTTAADDSSEAEAEPQGGVHCSDGSCFSCGEAVCLSGYYCAVGKAGHGCAWHPSCPSRTSCACLAPAIKANATCRCEEKSGGVYVTCDGASL